MIETIPLIRQVKFFLEKESSKDFDIDPEIYYLDIIKVNFHLSPFQN
jgi:hypothetical protein